MKTKLILIEGIELVAPVQYQPPWTKLSAFKRCCGAGNGIGERIVPDYNFWLSMSCPCHIHDFSWDVADPTWADFHQANGMFIRNQQSIIKAKSNFLMRSIRQAKAGLYYEAVDTVGAIRFAQLKGVEIL